MDISTARCKHHQYKQAKEVSKVEGDEWIKSKAVAETLFSLLKMKLYQDLVQHREKATEQV